MTDSSLPRRGLLSPFACFGPRPFREEHLRAYIVREHRAGRSLGEILADPYVRRLGPPTFCWRVAVSPRTLAALRRDTVAQIEACMPRSSRDYS
jgi:hypothetical protein